MEFAAIPVKKIKPSAYNPRLDLKPGDPEYEKLRRSMEEFGSVEPLVWNRRTGNLVGGHQRLKILRDRGDETVMVSVVDLAKSKEKALNLALNKVSGDWDTPKLKDLLEELDTGEFDLEITGFDESEVERLMTSTFRPGEVVPRLTEEEADNLGTDDAPVGYFDGVETFAVLFSGGKDSLAALVLLKQQFPKKEIVCFFSDTGVEFPGMTADVRRMARALGVELVVVRPTLDWWTWVEDKGWPSVMYRPCQTQLIFQPANREMRRMDPTTTIICGGQRKGQAVKGSKKQKYGSVPSLKGYRHYAPAFFATDETVWKLIEGLPVWPGYEKGFVRTACWCCPGQCRAQARALQKNFPGLANTIREWERRIGQPLRWTSKKGGRGVTFDDLLGSDVDDSDTILAE